jgi:hypothetical protein
LSTDIFSYISTAVSIVFAFSASHLLAGLRDVVAPRRRDWLVVGWFIYLAYLHLLSWWSLIAAQGLADWNLGTFTLAMAVPGFLYLALYALMSGTPAAVEGWRVHFERARPWFFTFYALFIAASALRETVLLHRAVISIASALDVISVVNASVGAIVSNRRAQVLIFALEVLLAVLVSAQRYYLTPS